MRKFILLEIESKLAYNIKLSFGFYDCIRKTDSNARSESSRKNMDPFYALDCQKIINTLIGQFGLDLLIQSV